MIGAVLAAAFSLVGHVVRDGWPAVHSTHLARLLGAVWVAFGLLAAGVSPLHASALGAALLVGFYVDMKHGEGQQARDWEDVPYLALSGITSLLPVAAVGFWTAGWWALAVPAVGLLKPPLWFSAWRVCNPASFLCPTRVAAGLFGALVGLTLWLVK